jgi:hypothetical protein
MYTPQTSKGPEKRAIEHAKAAGPNSVAADALDALTVLAEFASAKEGKDVKKLSLEALGAGSSASGHDNALQWFITKDAQHYAKGHADGAMSTVFGFGRALASGYAFLSRVYVGRSLETPYVGYDHALRCDPGAVLLDATADLGGMTQLCPWRVPRDIPQARYDRLTVVAEKPYPVRRLDLLFKKAQGRREYTEWMKEVIKRHTEPGQPTLIVCKLDLINNEHVTAPLWDLGDGYQVQVAHWGDGIGSNQWQQCTAVLLFGEFVIPRRVHIADTQGLLDCKSTDSSAPTMTMGAINGRNKQVHAIEAGHLLRFDKQMALRGNARHFDQDGTCGEQKLICCGDTKRLLVNLGRMYPGAKLVNGGGVGASTPRAPRAASRPTGTACWPSWLRPPRTWSRPLTYRPWNEIRRDVVTPAFKASLGGHWLGLRREGPSSSVLPLGGTGRSNDGTLSRVSASRSSVAEANGGTSDRRIGNSFPAHSNLGRVYPGIAIEELRIVNSFPPTCPPGWRGGIFGRWR